MPDKPGVLRRTLDAMYLAAGYLAGLCLIVIFVLMLVLSAGREFGINIPSGDDFAAFAMAAMAFLGLAHTFKSGEMIRVGLLIDRFSGRKRRLIEICSLLIGIAFISYFAWYAVRLTIDSYKLNDMSQGVIAIPIWIPQIAMCTGLVLLAVAMVDELIHVLAGNKPRYEKEPPQTAEEVVERAIASGV
jgi:TRAP-type C4-dicarboxylate transport system permease small subunit